MSDTVRAGMPRRVLTSSWLAAFVTLLAVGAILARIGIDVTDLVKYLLYLAFAVTLPGVAAWRALLSHLHEGPTTPTWFEDLSLGTIFGLGVQLPFFLVGVAVGAQWLLWVPTVAAVVLGFTPWGRGVIALPTAKLDPRAAWALGGIIVVGLLAFVENTLARRPMTVPPRLGGSIDDTFHQALIGDVANRFPFEMPFLLGTRMDYHWFVHAQIAASNYVTGMDSWTMLRAGILALVLVFGVLGLGAVAMRLTGRPVAAVVAPGLLVAGAFHMLGPDFPVGTYLEPYVMARRFAAATQSYGVMVSMPAVMLLLEVLRPDRRPNLRTWVALTLSLLMLMGTKVTFLPIFTAGVLGVWGVQLLRTRRVDGRLTVLAAIIATITVGAQFGIYGGNSGSMEFAPLKSALRAVSPVGESPELVVLMTATMLTAWLLSGVGIVGLIRRRMVLDPRVVWMVLSIAAAVPVPLMMYRSGSSQFWFSRSVAELLALLSAWGLALLLPRPLTVRRALPFVAAAAGAGLVAALTSAYLAADNPNPRVPSVTGMVATVLAPWVVAAAFGVAWLLFRRVREHGTITLALLLTVLLGLGTSNVWVLAKNVLEEPEGQRRFGAMFAAGGIPAAEFIERNSSPDAIVATNVHCADPPPGRCDNRSFWVSAYTQRRIVVEGWGYSRPTNDSASHDVANRYIPIPYPERLRINDAVFLRPSEEAVERLVEEYDVEWLFVSKKYPADLEGLAALPEVLEHRFENDNYVVYEVRSRQ